MIEGKKKTGKELLKTCGLVTKGVTPKKNPNFGKAGKKGLTWQRGGGGCKCHPHKLWEDVGW